MEHSLVYKHQDFIGTNIHPRCESGTDDILIWHNTLYTGYLQIDNNNNLFFPLSYLLVPQFPDSLDPIHRHLSLLIAQPHALQ